MCFIWELAGATGQDLPTGCEDRRGWGQGSDRPGLWTLGSTPL